MKKMSNRLALLGGPKTLNPSAPHYPWPLITKSAEKAVIQQLHTTVSIYDHSGIFEEFENVYAKMHKKKFGLLCSSGTLAIHSMFVAAQLKPGDEVICPAYTFFATVTPLLHTGATPVLCDCGEDGNIDPQEIEKKINKKTRAVVITHMWGVPCRMDEIVKLCKKNNLLLLEDCSHAHGATYKNRPIGSHGDISAWSIQGFKNISGGEGGMLVTDNPEYYYRALLLGHYNKRCRQEIPKNHELYQFAITGMGLKYRAHPLAVALAYEGLKNIKSYQKYRNIFAKKIIDALKPFPALTPVLPATNTKSSWYALIFKYHPEKLGGLSIERFYEAVKSEGLAEFDRPVSTMPLNLLPLFQRPDALFPAYKLNQFSYLPGSFPKAEKFYANVVKLPVWATISDKKIVNDYIRGIKKVLINYKQLL